MNQAREGNEQQNDPRQREVQLDRRRQAGHEIRARLKRDQAPEVWRRRARGPRRAPAVAAGYADAHEHLRN